MQKYKRAKTAEKLQELINNNPDFTIANIFYNLMRKKYMYDKVTNKYFMTDEDMLNAVTKLGEELEEFKKE